MWIVYAFLSAITASFVAIFAKLGLSNIDSTVATALRSLIMATFMCLVLVVLRKPFTAISGISAYEWLFIVLAGVSGALSWTFYFMALQQGTAYQVVGIDRLSMVFTLILSIIVLGEHVTLKSGLGALVMVAGAYLLIK